MLLIYLPAVTSRIQYTFKLILNDLLGINYQATTDIKYFEFYSQEKINYSASRIDNEIFIKASSLLFESSIKKIEIPVQKKYNTTVLFSNNTLCDLGFDVFSAVFFMVSRYEEYLPFTPDKYGRFKASDSLAYQNNFLKSPVVNIWINYFKDFLQKKFPLLTFRATSFKALITYDIDVAFAYKGRNLFRQIGATIKDILFLKFNGILIRFLTICNKQKDPWDIYDFLHDTITKSNLESIFFFLMADFSPNDRNLSYEQPIMKKLAAKISGFSDIGIHPSFKSSDIPEKILIEKKRLETLTSKQITKSRQHYLKFSLPNTYNHLIDAGIKEDYSMAFADVPGFRAGICSPFYFFDLKKEKFTDLKIFPVTFMEGTFIDYMKLSPSAASQIINNLIEQVVDVNGTFISIWHNHTISETKMYKAWRDVHNKMIEKILLTVKPNIR